ncbi:MAG TPA: LLM class F420-dependent oxidoreductase [Actinomycetota bacterium]|nr:LLM class F420-dependent oxidoreductase [Actinomycetota bacterium]
MTRPVEIGLHLPSAQPAATAEGILAVARTAEELGFDSVWCFDHLFTPVDLESLYPYSRDGSYAMSANDPFFDPLALFGVLAGATERVKIGTGVLIGAYRHPIVLAKALASIENFAPGRLVLGIGAGWMREEFDALGVPYERRGARLDEYIEALRTIWSGASSSFEGDSYRWPESGFLPAPTGGASGIPLIVGGHSDAALARAARIGDGWAVVTGRGQGSGIDALLARIEVMQSLLEKEGRSGDDFVLMLQHLLWFSDAPNPKLPFTGPPEAIAENLVRLRDAGVSMIDLIVYGPPPVIVESAERFAREVRPLV